MSRFLLERRAVVHVRMLSLAAVALLALTACASSTPKPPAAPPGLTSQEAVADCQATFASDNPYFPIVPGSLSAAPAQYDGWTVTGEYQEEVSGELRPPAYFWCDIARSGAAAVRFQ